MSASRAPVAEFPKVAKTVLVRGLAEPQAMRPAMGGPIELVRHKRVKQATLQPMVFRQLAADARAPGTNFKHCRSD